MRMQCEAANRAMVQVGSSGRCAKAQEGKGLSLCTHDGLYGCDSRPLQRRLQAQKQLQPTLLAGNFKKSSRIMFERAARVWLQWLAKRPDKLVAAGLGSQFALHIFSSRLALVTSKATRSHLAGMSIALLACLCVLAHARCSEKMLPCNKGRLTIASSHAQLVSKMARELCSQRMQLCCLSQASRPF